jgi:hypothetical protein
MGRLQAEGGETTGEKSQHRPVGGGRKHIRCREARGRVKDQRRWRDRPASCAPFPSIGEEEADRFGKRIDGGRFFYKVCTFSRGAERQKSNDRHFPFARLHRGACLHQIRCRIAMPPWALPPRRQTTEQVQHINHRINKRALRRDEMSSEQQRTTISNASLERLTSKSAIRRPKRRLILSTGPLPCTKKD